MFHLWLYVLPSSRCTVIFKIKGKPMGISSVSLTNLIMENYDESVTEILH